MIKDAGRLRWMCRRGMLELDVIFERFLDRDGYAKLTADQQVLFETFMQEPDPKLFGWLLGHEQAPGEYAELIKQVLG